VPLPLPLSSEFNLDHLKHTNAHSNWTIQREIDRFANTKTDLLVYSAMQHYS
jgi:hypothetical protein